MSISSLCGSGTPTVSSRRPKILFVATSRNDGGLERYSVQMAARLASTGADMCFACAPGEIVETLCRTAGIATLPLSTRNSADFGCARTLADQIIAQGIDIVHVHSRRDYVTATLGVASARRRLKASDRRPKLLLHAHMLRPLGSPPGLSGRFFRWGADAVLANSNTVRDLLIECHRLPPAFVQLLHNGVALDRFALPHSPEAIGQRAQARREGEITSEAFVLGMVGRLDAKGQRHLLEIVPELAQKYPTLRVVLIGSGGLPGERERLLGQAKAGGFAERLVLTGPREDVPALLPAFDVLVHLPTDESFGLALTEAMAGGLPTVATDISACREVVQDGVTGYLVAPGAPAALVAALDSLLDADAGLMRRRAMGQAGRSAVESKFSQAQQIERLQGLYEELGRASQRPETIGRRQAIRYAGWAASGLAVAVTAGGLFAHAFPRHVARPQTHHARFPVVAMKSHSLHTGRVYVGKMTVEPHTP